MAGAVKHRRRDARALEAAALAALCACACAFAPARVSADGDAGSGLLSGQRFEAWVRYARPEGPHATSMRLHAGDSLRITFPPQFVPLPGQPEAYFVYGHPAGDAALGYRVSVEGADRRTLALTASRVIDRAIPVMPGLQSVHVAAPLRNPPPGTYTLSLLVIHGTRVARGHETIAILGRAVPRIAAYDGLHPGRRANFQHVSPGALLPVPLDFLITDPDGTHPADLTLLVTDERPGVVTVMREGTPVGTITGSGGVRLQPEAAPQVGIVRVSVRAPRARGRGLVIARLQGGTSAQITFGVGK